MIRLRYSLLIALPALIVCWPVGKAAKRTEIWARRIRMMCARKMYRVISGAPKQVE